MGNDVQIVNGVTMPPLHNMRAGKMWEIISAHVDFVGKRVADLGCGYGDLLLRIYASGAELVAGYDRTAKVLVEVGKKLNLIDADHRRIDLIQEDLDDIDILPCDIIICCSVLPYIEVSVELLGKMHRAAPLSIIECQYAGDGPGFDVIKDDADMEQWLLSVGWTTVTAIGRTRVEDRDKWRTIWKCQR